MEQQIIRLAAPTRMQAEPGSEVRTPMRVGRRRRPARERAQLVIVAVIVVLTGCLVVGLTMLAAMRTAAPVPPRTDAGISRVGTVVLPSDGESCRRMAFENSGGAMWEIGSVRCGGAIPQDPQEAVRQRYSGGRLDAIRKGFSER